MSPKPSEPKFETIVSELETIVSELDSPIGLEESLAKFKRGMELADAAEKRLQTIENQFERIRHDFSTSTNQIADESAEAAI